MNNIEEAKQKAYDIACEFEKKYGSCSQCLLAGLQAALGKDVITDEVFKSASAFGNGVAGAGCTCGALIGGAMAIGCYIGRDPEHLGHPELIREGTFPLSRKLVDRFEEKYGKACTSCTAVQVSLLGRSFDLYRGQGDREAFYANGMHDQTCSEICADAAVWVIEILDEAGLI